MSIVSIDAKKTTVVAVVGPTAVGKSALAQQIALELGGEIVSADSMQVYRGMDIGTAKLADSERLVVHHCIDVADPGMQFSAALYQNLARCAIEECQGRGALPVLCGGTGLYVRAALDDWRFASAAPHSDEGQNRYERYAEEHGRASLHELLRERDPESAKLIHPNNSRRVMRALELFDMGESYAAKHAGLEIHESIYDARFVGLTMEREMLYARIEQRVDEMMETGLLREVETLVERGYGSALIARQAIGYKELVSVVRGTVDLDEAVDAIKLASRHYAKRQLTWFRADPRIVWIDVTELSPERVRDEALSAIGLHSSVA